MGKNWAIVVGINNYDNLQSLKYAKRDAEVIATWLRDEAKFNKVFLFTDDSPSINEASPPILTQPTHARFLRFLNVQFESPLLKPEDNLWFFFAGHGKRYEDQDYLMFLDSDPDPRAVDRTAISVEYVTQRLRRSGADNVVLFVDACRDEGDREGMGIGIEEHKGVITFYSCAANQKSWEIDELQHGSFTHKLLEGLRLQGEANCATVERLDEYLRHSIPRLNISYKKPVQNPCLKAEPPYKLSYVLLEQYAQHKDVEPLKYQASQAEIMGDFSLAKQLWMRVLAVPPIDMHAVEAIERIARCQSSRSSEFITSSNEDGLVTSDNGNSPDNGSSPPIARNSSTNSKTGSVTLVASKVTYEFVLTGNIDEVNKQRLDAIVAHLKQLAKDTSVTLLEVKSSSIKLILEGSEEGFRLLESLVASGELKQVLGMPVQRITRRTKGLEYSVASGEIEQVLGMSTQRIRTGTDTRTTVIGSTHEDFAALLDKYDYHFSPGDIVAGTVFSMEPRGALIDIGAKTAAYIPIQEMSINRVDAPEEVLQPNETREFFILTDENEDGQLTLSIRRIEYMRAWERVRQLQSEDVTVRSLVFATNRGGALVRIEGLRGFIPSSHISTRKLKEELVGEELPLKFLEVDEDRNRLVLSHRRALVERKMNRLEVGEVVIGTVRGIKPYGAFIDIGGVSGLLHISEISHDHIDTPHSVFNVNDEVTVMIVDLDADRGRISLSTKVLEPEPGDMLRTPQIVYDRAEEMAAKYRETIKEIANASDDEFVDDALASDDEFVDDAFLNDEFESAKHPNKS